MNEIINIQKFTEWNYLLNHSKPNKEEFTEPFSISQEEIDELITSLKEEKNN